MIGRIALRSDELWIPRVRLTLDIADAPRRAAEFFIGIFDSDSTRISRKRCTARARDTYCIPARARTRSRLCESLVNLRLPFIEIYAPKHLARRRRLSRYHAISIINAKFSQISRRYRLLVWACKLRICICAYSPWAKFRASYMKYAG